LVSALEGFGGLRRHQSSTAHIQEEFICRCQASPVRARAKFDPKKARKTFQWSKRWQGSTSLSKVTSYIIPCTDPIYNIRNILYKYKRNTNPVRKVMNQISYNKPNASPVPSAISFPPPDCPKQECVPEASRTTLLYPEKDLQAPERHVDSRVQGRPGRRKAHG
jgi:hypothetical protein